MSILICPTHDTTGDHDAAACRRLWQAVVYNAILDAVFDRRNGHPSDPALADKWLRSNCADFREVCDNAGMDPDFVRDAYINGRLDAERLREDTAGRKRTLA